MLVDGPALQVPDLGLDHPPQVAGRLVLGLHHAVEVVVVLDDHPALELGRLDHDAPSSKTPIIGDSGGGDLRRPRPRARAGPAAPETRGSPPPGGSSPPPRGAPGRADRGGPTPPPLPLRPHRTPWPLRPPPWRPLRSGRCRAWSPRERRHSGPPTPRRSGPKRLRSARPAGPPAPVPPGPRWPPGPPAPE